MFSFLHHHFRLQKEIRCNSSPSSSVEPDQGETKTLGCREMNGEDDAMCNVMELSYFSENYVITLIFVNFFRVSFSGGELVSCLSCRYTVDQFS